MGTTLAQGYVQIIPSAKGISGSISKVLNGEAASAGKSAGTGIAGAIKGAIAAAGIGTALKAALTEGAALEQSLGGIEAIFGKSADTVKNNASQAFREAGISANSYMEQATSFSARLLQGLGGDTEKTAQYTDLAIKDMSDNINRFGSDAQSVQQAYQGFAKNNFTMLDNLKLGYGGTKTEMARLINDMGVLGDTFVTVGQKGNFDEVVTFDKMIEAIHLAQEQLNVTGTTAQEAEHTISGSFNMMKAAAQDFAGNLTLGQNVTPALENLGSTVITFAQNLIPAIKNIVIGLPTAIIEVINSHGGQMLQTGTQFIQNLGNGLKTGIPEFLANALPMVTDFSGKLREGAGQLVDSGLELIKNIAQGIADSIPTLVQNIPTIVSNIAGIINDNAPKLLKTGIEIIGTLAKGIIQAAPTIAAEFPKIAKAAMDVFTAFNWMSLGTKALTAVKSGVTSMKEVVPNLLKDIGNKAMTAFKSINWASDGKSAIDFIKTAATGAGSLVVNALKTIGTTAMNAFKGIDWKGVGKAAIEFIKTAASGAGSLVVNVLKTIGSNAMKAFKAIDWKGVGKAVITFIQMAITGAGHLILNALKTAGTAALNAFKQINWLQLGKDVVAGIVNGVKNAAGTLLTALKNLAKDALNAAKEKLGIASPSKVFEDEVGKNIALGVADGVTNNADNAKKSVEQMSNAVITAAKNKMKEWKATEDVTAEQEATFWQTIAQNVEQGTGAYATALDNASKAVKKYEEEQNKLQETISGQINMFEHFDRKTEISSEQMIKNMKSQVLAVKEWANNLKELAKRGIDEGLLQQLAQLGPQGYEQVAAFVSMTDSQLQDANRLFSKSLALPESAMNTINQSYAIAGQNASTGFAGGVNPTAGNAAAQQLAQNTLSQIQTGLDEHSPSKKTEQMGKYLTQGLANGMTGEKGSITSAVNTVGNNVINGFKGLSWANTGKGIIDTIKGAFTSNGNNVVSALKTIGDNSLKSFKGLQWVQHGKTAVDYVKNGINGAANNIVNALRTAGNNALSGFRGISWSDLGHNIIDGIVSGISSAASNLFSALRDLASDALEAAKDALDIGSPSKVFSKEVGRWIPEGIADGIERNLNPVESAMDKATDLTMEKANAQIGMNGLNASASGAKKQVVTNLGGVTIYINAQDYNNANDVAEAVSNLINRRVRQYREAWA